MPPSIDKDRDEPYFFDGIWKSSRNGSNARRRAIWLTQALIRDTILMHVLKQTVTLDFIENFHQYQRNLLSLRIT